MISNLPNDIQEKILLRVPVKSLRRLRSTCKQWYHHVLFKDPIFNKRHSDKPSSTRMYLALMLMDYRVYLMSSNLNGVHIDVSHWLKGKLRLMDRQNQSEVDISQAFHCDGILLCTTVDNKFVLWNPFSRTTSWIEARNHHNRYELYALGYDNNEVCRSYKILRFIDIRNNMFEIYEFSSDSWRNLDVSPDGYLQSRCGVSLQGNTYWISIRRIRYDYTLLRFDFSTERFQHLSLPFQEAQPSDAVALSVVREERLSLLHQSAETQKMEIWVTNEIDTAFVSWSKFLIVDLNPRLPKFSRCMSFFIDEEKKVVVLHDQERQNKVYIVKEDEYKESPSLYHLRFRGMLKCWPNLFSYFPYRFKLQNQEM